MRDGIEYMKQNKRVRIFKFIGKDGVAYDVQVNGFAPTMGFPAWQSVARRGNIEEARIVARCFASLVEEPT